MCRLFLSLIYLIPKSNFARCQRFRQVDYSLIFRAAEFKHKIFLVLFKSSVNQYVDKAQQFVSCFTSRVRLFGLKLFKRKSRKSPDVFVGVSFLYSFYKREQCALIFRLKRLAAKQCKAVYIARCEHLNYLLFSVFGKLLTVAEIPSLRLEATLTSVGATRHEEGDSHPFAVSNVAILNLSVVHITGGAPFP